MHGPTIAAPGVLLAVLLCLGCGSPAATTPAARAPDAGDRASTSAPRPEHDFAAALEAVERLESAIAAARAAVKSASATAATASADQRLWLSDTRRAIVAANVALQKAREALSRGDYAAAQQAAVGMAEHLKGISAKLGG